MLFNVGWTAFSKWTSTGISNNYPPRKDDYKMPLTIFLSHAHEDARIAVALNNTLSKAFGSEVVVYLDKFFMHPGGPLAGTVQQHTAQADMMIIIATGRGRPSHDWGGFELGSFVSTHRERPANAHKLWGRTVCFCWDERTVPDQLKGNLHVTLEVADHELIKSGEDYFKTLAIARDDRVLRLFEELHQVLTGSSVSENRTELERMIERVKEFKRDVFGVYKNRIRDTKKLEKQMILRYPSKDIAGPGGKLKESVSYRLLGGAGTIFGMSDNPENDRQWCDHFVEHADSQQHGRMWVQTIQRLLRLGMVGGVEGLSHALIILGQDGLTLYRPVLTTLSIFNNDEREASIYFIEIKKRVGHGDPGTTKLLDGIDAICRFRFLFLEEDSPYSPLNAHPSAELEDARRFADELMSEIYYIENDLTAAGLDKPASWARYVSPESIRTMTAVWFPLREKLFADCLNVIACQGGEDLKGLMRSLSATLTETRERLLPHNSELLSRLTASLGAIALDSPGLGNVTTGRPAVVYSGPS